MTPGTVRRNGNYSGIFNRREFLLASRYGLEYEEGHDQNQDDQEDYFFLLLLHYFFSS